MGLSPSARRRLERAVAAAMGGVQHGRCRSTFLALELGASGPESQTARRLLVAWPELLTHASGRAAMLRRMQRAWPRALTKVYQVGPSKRWFRDKGPMG